jgi:hypothetical protein
MSHKGMVNFLQTSGARIITIHGFNNMMDKKMPLITCTDCKKEMSDLAPACPHCGKPFAPPTDKRRVGFWLGLGIVLIPIVFVWFTLRKGHTPVSRFAGFSWLFLIIVISIIDTQREPINKSENNSPTETKTEVNNAPVIETNKSLESVNKQESKKTENKFTAKQLRDCKDTILAHIMAQKFVTDKLKAPSTAEFSDYGDSGTSAKHIGDCSHEILGYVDSQNGFGAMIRTTYYAIVKNDIGTNNWRLIHMETQ